MYYGIEHVLKYVYIVKLYIISLIFCVCVLKTLLAIFTLFLFLQFFIPVKFFLVSFYSSSHLEVLYHFYFPRTSFLFQYREQYYVIVPLIYNDFSSSHFCPYPQHLPILLFVEIILTFSFRLIFYTTLILSNGNFNMCIVLELC